MLTHMLKKFRIEHLILCIFTLLTLSCGGSGSGVDNDGADTRISIKLPPQTQAETLSQEVLPRQFENVVSAVVRITGNFSPITTTIDVPGQTTVLVPVQNNVQFTVEAFDANDNIVCTGTAEADIFPGINSVTISCALVSEICNDGIDNDSDGSVDCQDIEDCEGFSCDPQNSEFVCTDQGECTVPTPSPTPTPPPPSPSPPPAEFACFDDTDNDEDGQVDCEDSDCIGRICIIGNPESVCLAGECLIPAVDTGSISGIITDATNAQPIAGATVQALQNGSIVTTATTGSDGTYTIPQIPVGTYTILVSAPDFLENMQENVQVTTDQNTVVNLSLSPPLEEGELRIILTWGAMPTDLDSHLWLPPNIPFHIAFFRLGDVDMCPFAELDVDDTSSFGPETITISQFFSGTYLYAVMNFSTSPDITISEARVQVFDSTGLISTFNIPTTGMGLWWTVFSIDGDTGVITPINTVGEDPSPYPDTDAGCAMMIQ